MKMNRGAQAPSPASLKSSAQPGAAAVHNFRGRELIATMSTFHRRNLPHIEKDGASYFVNFSTRNDFVIPEQARTLIFNHCLFENGHKVHMHAFVVMPTHVHLLFTPLEGDKGEPYSLTEIMQGIKGASSHSVNKFLGRKGALWEAESFDRIPRSDADFEYRVLYIVQNPIAAGLAHGPDDYRWAWRESAQPRAAAIHKSSP
jgi:REP element-mobilizing transposase RayT